jgi:ornithine cyclodeaminase
VFVVTDSDLRRLVPMADAIDAVGEAFRSLSEGSSEQPPRIAFADGTGLAMAARRRRASDGDSGGSAFKLVSVRPQNRERGLPTIHAVALWFDGETGSPLLLVEGSGLTALRTGAASGYATRLLASPTAATLAMIGAGGQALDQVRAVCAVRPIEHVRVFTPTGVSARTLAKQVHAEFAIDARAAASVTEAIDGADVVCCATNATTPVFGPNTIAGRVHVNAVGSYRPDMRELPGDLVATAEVFAVDEVSAALAEAGEVIHAVRKGLRAEAEFVEIGTVSLDTAALRGPTVFKSVGVAIQDWAICRLLAARVALDAPAVELMR